MSYKATFCGFLLPALAFFSATLTLPDLQPGQRVIECLWLDAMTNGICLCVCRPAVALLVVRPAALVHPDVRLYGHGLRMQGSLACTHPSVHVPS